MTLPPVLRRFWDALPVPEGCGVLLGVLGFDLVAEGRANFSKAFLAAFVFSLIVALWRCRRRP